MLFNDEFLAEFNSRFLEFREIEEIITRGKHKDSACLKSFFLLYNMELCYAAKAYYACIIIACSAIEASLSQELGNEGSLKSMIMRSGYKSEADWLRVLRNEIVHKNDNSFVDNEFDENQEENLKEKCKQAFILVHKIHYNPINNV